MAIDTVAKRSSALNAFMLGIVLPVPDGTIAQADMQHILGFYGGILATSDETGAIFTTIDTRVHQLADVGARQQIAVSAGSRQQIGVMAGTR